MLHSVLFLAGLGLAALVVYAVSVPSSSELASSHYRSRTSELTPVVARSLVRASRSGAEVGTGHGKRATSLGDTSSEHFALGEDFEEIEAALDLQSPDSLRLISSGFLRELPGADTEILPLVRGWALDRMVARMTDADWNRWPQAGESGHPSVARSYIDKIATVNTDLATYLETAGWLLYELHGSTFRGEPFDATSALKNLLENTEHELQRWGSVGAVRTVFTPLILLDPPFRTRLEVERCRLVSSVLPLQSRSLEAEMRLITSLDAKHCDPNTYRKVAETIAIVVQSRDDRLRRALLEAEQRSRSLSLFAVGDDRVREALAELYAITAVSELERGNTSVARSYLVESLGLKPGLRSQAFLEDFFRQTSFDPGLHSRSDVLYFESGSQEPTESVSLVFSGLMILVVFGPLIWLFRRLYMGVPAVRPSTPQLAAVVPKGRPRSGGTSASAPAVVIVDGHGEPSFGEEIDFNDRPRLIQNRGG